MIYARVASATKWTYKIIDDLTLHDVNSLYEYWSSWPPENELLALQVGYEKPLTIEEKFERGAMGPADFFAHFQRTKGKVN